MAPLNFVIVHMRQFKNTPYASMMVKSLRRYMPDANVIQISDDGVDHVDGADFMVIRYPFVYNRIEYRKVWFQRIYDIALDQLIYVDCDMLFCADISEILDGDFDVAVCVRDYDDGTGPRLRDKSPYNMGLVASNTREFWKECQRTSEALNYYKENTPQAIVGKVIDSDKFKVKYLSGFVYNHSPANVDDYDPAVKVWHFKGDRKEWMEEWQTAHIK